MLKSIIIFERNNNIFPAQYYFHKNQIMHKYQAKIAHAFVDLSCIVNAISRLIVQYFWNACSVSALILRDS